MSKHSRTWLITGCSTGLGRGLVEALIPTGDIVVATARNTDSLKDFAQHPNVHVMKLDVTSHENNAEVVDRIEQDFGGIDVLVNNAGYGYIAAVEEADESTYRHLFETNFFGLVDLTRAVLPGMRERKRGRILNVSSVGGMVGNPGSAFYAGTKFAVVGFSEALSKEVASFGVHVTVIAPGPFRTDWAGRSLKSTHGGIADYDAVVHKRLEDVSKSSGTQQGDPRRAADAMLAVVNSENPPLHLILGAQGLEVVRKNLASLGAEFDAWEAVTTSADFPPGA